jgi:hypothetical protein
MLFYSPRVREWGTPSDVVAKNAAVVCLSGSQSASLPSCCTRPLSRSTTTISAAKGTYATRLHDLGGLYVEDHMQRLAGLWFFSTGLSAVVTNQQHSRTAVGAQVFEYFRNCLEQMSSRVDRHPEISNNVIISTLYRYCDPVPLNRTFSPCTSRTKEERLPFPPHCVEWRGVSKIIIRTITPFSLSWTREWTKKLKKKTCG